MHHPPIHHQKLSRCLPSTFIQLSAYESYTYPLHIHFPTISYPHTHPTQTTRCHRSSLTQSTLSWSPGRPRKHARPNRPRHNKYTGHGGGWSRQDSRWSDRKPGEDGFRRYRGNQQHVQQRGQIGGGNPGCSREERLVDLSGWLC